MTERAWEWQSFIKSCRLIAHRSRHGFCLREARKSCSDSSRQRDQPNRSPRWRAMRRVRPRRWLMANILVCDDMRAICGVLEIALRKEGHRVETVNSGEAAKKKLDSAIFD